MNFSTDIYMSLPYPLDLTLQQLLWSPSFTTFSRLYLTISFWEYWTTVLSYKSYSVSLPSRLLGRFPIEWLTEDWDFQTFSCWEDGDKWCSIRTEWPSVNQIINLGRMAFLCSEAITFCLSRLCSFFIILHSTSLFPRPPLNSVPAFSLNIFFT